MSIREKHNTLKVPKKNKKPTSASTSNADQLAVIDPSSKILNA